MGNCSGRCSGHCSDMCGCSGDQQETNMMPSEMASGAPRPAPPLKPLRFKASSHVDLPECNPAGLGDPLIRWEKSFPLYRARAINMIHTM